MSNLPTAVGGSLVFAAVARLNLLITAVLVLVFWMPLSDALAADEERPDAMILRVSADVLDAIRNDKAVRAGDFDRVQKLVNERILPYVDFDKMTRLAVGRSWRGASSEQRGELIDQFRTLLLRTYSGALSKVTDHKVRLRPARGQDSPNDVIVRTEVVPSQGEPITLDYRLEKTPEGWKIYDMNILGVWLVETYKSEFAESISQGGVDALIKALTEKNRRLASASKAT
ncbi:MAG TPA: ABC transporter substrate-binding protein [Burkholderiaceae bacterium]|nr:ABC transporter substrate-binding protein [Burkholderiaceae bacterium]